VFRDESGEGIEGVFGFGAAGDEFEARAFLGGDADEVEDGATVEFAAFVVNLDFGLEAASEGDEFFGGAEVESEVIDDGDGLVCDGMGGRVFWGRVFWGHGR
jgi:hypothetical protein